MLAPDAFSWGGETATQMRRMLSTSKQRVGKQAGCPHAHQSSNSVRWLPADKMCKRHTLLSTSSKSSNVAHGVRQALFGLRECYTVAASSMMQEGLQQNHTPAPWQLDV